MTEEEKRRHARDMARDAAEKNPPNYYTGADFEPHGWVIDAVMQGISFGMGVATEERKQRNAAELVNPVERVRQGKDEPLRDQAGNPWPLARGHVGVDPAQPDSEYTVAAVADGQKVVHIGPRHKPMTEAERIKAVGERVDRAFEAAQKAYASFTGGRHIHFPVQSEKTEKERLRALLIGIFWEIQ